MSLFVSVLQLSYTLGQGKRGGGAVLVDSVSAERREPRPAGKGGLPGIQQQQQQQAVYRTFTGRSMWHTALTHLPGPYSALAACRWTR